jgi:hypothetical protein
MKGLVKDNYAAVVLRFDLNGYFTWFTDQGIGIEDWHQSNLDATFS